MRAINANIEIRIACRSLSHRKAINMKTFNSTYEEIDLIKGVKKL